jgi:hypothetical protein
VAYPISYRHLEAMMEERSVKVDHSSLPMMGFKSIRSAAATLAGIELMHMIRKDQMTATGRLRRHNSFMRWLTDFHCEHMRVPPWLRIRDRTAYCPSTGWEIQARSYNSGGGTTSYGRSRHCRWAAL